MQFSIRRPRPSSRRRATAVLTMFTVAVMLVAGCSSGASGPAGEPGHVAPNALRGQTYTVSGKEFPEQLILCQIALQALQAAGAQVNDRCNLVTTAANREALTSGQVDMYWEYTGTAWQSLLGRTESIPDAAALHAAVKQADAANGITWLDMTPFSNAYAMAVGQGAAQRLGLRTISDMARVVGANSSDSRTCLEPEFASRPDGWIALQRAYGFTAPPDKVSIRTFGGIYVATSKGDPCVFGEVYATDAQVRSANLELLEDDKNVLPKYNASISIRTEVLDRTPAVAQVFAPITAALTEEVMTDLNAQVAGQGRQPADVARDWLRSQGIGG